MSEMLKVTDFVSEIKCVENHSDFAKIGGHNSAWSTGVYSKKIWKVSQHRPMFLVIRCRRGSVAY